MEWPPTHFSPSDGDRLSLAKKHQGIFPEAAIIQHSMYYVDDLLFGASTREKASIRNISHILIFGCFELRK